MVVPLALAGYADGAIRLSAPAFRGWSLLPGELMVDNFAGGGGASVGQHAGAGRPPDIAINHSRKAIAMHAANHPDTRHFCEDILDVDPLAAAGGRPVGLAWFSPDCRHFSRAKGTAPRSKATRALAWVVVRWARAVKPRIIMLENVAEFLTWGPLDDDGQPIKERAGEIFREWLAALRGCGYHVEYRTLVGADYGAPTTRKRLFLIARCDGAPIVWPAASHGDGKPLRWRSAAEIIDWSLPCPSIFERKRPLAEATLARIAKGIQRYVVDAGDPFIVPVKSWGGGGNGPRSIRDPMRTITASKRGEFAIVEPFIIRHGHYSNITGAGLREGCGAGTFRGQQLGLPLATICATNDKHLVCPIVTKHYGGPNGHQVIGHPVTKTIGTVTARDHHALTAAFLTKFYGTSTGSSARAPMPTVTSGGRRGGGHIGEVRAFLTKYYSAGGNPRSQNMDLSAPLHTVTTKARFGLVMVRGVAYRIVDIGMRMLEPHELFAAQGLPDDYIIDLECDGKPLTKTDQTDLAGNAVNPQVAEALVRANCVEAPRMAA